MAGPINFDSLHYTKPPLKKSQVEHVQAEQWILPDLPPLEIPLSYQTPTQNPMESLGEGVGEFFSELEEGISSFCEEISDGMNSFGESIAEAIEDMADFFKLN